MLQHDSAEERWTARDHLVGEHWQPLSDALAERYGLEALLDLDDLTRVRESLGWDRQTFARAILDLLSLELAHWKPQPDGTLLLQLDLPEEQQPLVALAIMEFWDGVLEDIVGG